MQRSVKFVKYLPQFGWVPTVVAADDQYYWARDDTLLSDIPPGTRVKRLSPARPHLLYSLFAAITSDAVSRKTLDNIFIPDDRIIWALKAALYARTIIREGTIRLIYTTSPPHSAHIAGLILKRMTGLPWVADFRDPWTGDFRYDPPTRWVRKVHTYCERKILEGADRVICITDSTRHSYITGFGINPGRLVTIYNGFDASDFGVDHRRRDASSSRIVITHSGSFYGTYFPDTFIHALAEVLNNDADLRKRITMRFIGVMEKGMEERIRRVLPDHCVFSGYVSHPEAVKAVMESDINLIALPVEERVSYMVSGKLFEYLAAGKPILAIAPRGEAARIIETAKAGIVLSQNGVHELSDALRRAIPLLAGTGGGVSDKRTIDGFERKCLTGQLARVFDDVIGE